MIAGDLPPSSSVTEARFFAAAAITIFPTRVLPVKKTWSNGSSRSASATAASPSIIATSFSGKASARSARRARLVSGTFSEGLMITTLPAATAPTSGQRTREAG